MCVWSAVDSGMLTVAIAFEYLRVMKNLFDVFALITSASLAAHMMGEQFMFARNWISARLSAQLCVSSDSIS